MTSKKSIRKTLRLEAIANEAFKRFSAASWELELARGDEYELPAPAAEQAALKAAFWSANTATAKATLRLNLRNVSARFARRRITKDEIPAVCERLRRSENAR